MNTVFVLTDGKGKYIRYDEWKEKFVVVKNTFVAEKFDTMSTAKNIKGVLPKSLKKKFKVQEIEDNENPVQMNTVNSILPFPVPNNAVLNLEEPKNKTEHEDKDNHSDKSDIKSSSSGSSKKCFKTFDEEEYSKLKSEVSQEVLTNIREQKTELLKQLDLKDREILDVLHYIEFSRLNACDGYKAYRLIKKKRLERRIIKDKIEVLEELDTSINSIIQNVFDRLSNRKYNPRELPELFN